MNEVVFILLIAFIIKFIILYITGLLMLKIISFVLKFKFNNVYMLTLYVALIASIGADILSYKKIVEIISLM